MVNTAFHIQKPLIYAVAFQKVFFQNLVGPLSELNATFGFYTISDRKYDIEVVIFYVASYPAISLNLNCRKICDSSNTVKFLFKCIVDMLADSFYIPVKQ